MKEEEFKLHIDRLIHELKMPVVAIRGAIEFTRHELKSKNITLEPDYLDEAWHYSDLLSTMLRNADVLRWTGRPISPDRSRRVSFLSGVLSPSIQSVEVLLRTRGQTSSDIRLCNVDIIPPLYIDAQQMQLVFYNLLSNAIRYSGKGDLHIEIAASVSDDGWLVYVRDWGMGVDSSESKYLFHEHYRGKQAISHDVTGSGLGLYICDSILSANDSSIRLTNCSLPTEFTILFPYNLSEEDITL